MNVGLYARISTGDQQTLPMQIQALKKYATQRKWKIAIQIEDTCSGTKDRPQRDLILKAARRREIDAILVWRLDRWGRSLADLMSSLKELSDLGVGFVSLTEALDLTTASGRAMAGLLAVFAEFERDLLGERVKAGIAHARKLGKPHGRPNTTSDKIAQVKALFSKGYSKSKISKGIGISRTSVRRLLLQPDDPKTNILLQETPASMLKKIKLDLWLRVENNNKFVRGKGKVRKEIEDYIFSEFEAEKLDDDGYEYEITVPYENDTDLDSTIEDMLYEMSNTADCRNCFIEADVRTKDGEKSW